MAAVMALNAKNTQSFRDISEIERSNQEESALRPSKVENYMSRMRGKRDEALRAEDLQRMSWAKFLSRVTRGGRGQRLSLRRKPCIVKEKPFLQLDAWRDESTRGKSSSTCHASKEEISCGTAAWMKSLDKSDATVISWSSRILQMISSMYDDIFEAADCPPPSLPMYFVK